MNRGSSTRSGRSIALHSRAKLASDAGDDAHVLAVGGGVVVERRGVREPVALARAHDAEPVVGRRASTRGCAARRRRARRRSPRRFRRAVRVACVQRGRRGLRGEHAGEVVGDRDADAHGRAVGIAGEVEQAAVADADPVEAGPLRVRPVLAEAAMRTITSCGSRSRRADVPLLERAGPEVLDDDVGVARRGAGTGPGPRACAGRA